jgi:hypothetical protein
MEEFGFICRKGLRKAEAAEVDQLFQSYLPGKHRLISWILRTS